jgi:protection-of-telomeres protein 1
MWAGGISLLANVNTEFHILPKDSIPRELLGGAVRPPWQNYPRSGSHRPTAAETSYVVWSYNHIDELYLPSVGEFQARAQQAMNVREKFTLLKDAKPDTFHDILGEVIKIFDGSGMLTVYLSDYTANSLFYNYIWGGGGPVETRDGDEYGYIPSKPKSDKDWPGPFGKMTIQLTIFDGHADVIRDQVKVNQWLLLKNVQFKYGRMGGCLEGVLRGDREAFEGKVQVQIMEPSEEPEGNNARWKEAVRRKREWWKKFEKQKQDILNEAVGLGDKRKCGVEVVKKNAKQRRKELRAAGDKASNSGTKLAEPLDLNENSM